MHSPMTKPRARRPCASIRACRFGCRCSLAATFDKRRSSRPNGFCRLRAPAGRQSSRFIRWRRWSARSARALAAMGDFLRHSPLRRPADIFARAGGPGLVATLRRRRAHRELSRQARRFRRHAYLGNADALAQGVDERRGRSHRSAICAAFRRNRRRRRASAASPPAFRTRASSTPTLRRRRASFSPSTTDAPGFPPPGWSAPGRSK